MAEYIDRQALGIGKCNPEIFDDKGYANGWNAAIDIIQSAPAANVRPVVRGEWVQVMGKYDWMVKCSRCNGVPLETSNFCPNCGADMREERA